MGFTILILLGIAWLLWTIHEELVESNDRQRSLQSTMQQLVQRLEPNQAPVESPATVPASEAVNINTASKSQLQSLPRIGARGAEHIIAARPYADVAQLQDVQGISASVFAEIVDKITT